MRRVDNPLFICHNVSSCSTQQLPGGTLNDTYRKYAEFAVWALVIVC